MSKIVRCLVLCGLLAGAPFFVTIRSAALANDPEAGRALAQQWCSSCHSTAPGAVGSEVVPSFEMIAQERERSSEWLRTWLSVPHGEMPDFNLTRQEIDALVAYLKSLGVQPN